MILVTGAAGTVGAEIVKRLQTLGARFRAAYYTKSKADALAVTPRAGDVHRPWG